MDEATLLNFTVDEIAEVMRLDWNSSMLEDAAQLITDDDGEQRIVAVLKKVIKYVISKICHNLLVLSLSIGAAEVELSNNPLGPIDIRLFGPKFDELYRIMLTV